ncbi:MAG: translation elongation factor Ts [Planctomycetota bacterium]|nr:MAG: translation elongation factor Ts [Planctomycetota bacterium]
MSQITASAVAALRAKTGAGMMDCKKALVETGGDEDKAMEVLRQKGLKTADKKSTRTTGDGRVFAYIHHNQKVGVLLEVSCETDFVARGDDFETLLKDLAMHVAAVVPTPVSVEVDGVPQDLVEKERAVLLGSEDMQGKPAEIQEKIVGGRLKKFVADLALMDQEFVKNPDMSVRDVVTAVIAKVGENIKINRFVRFELGAED